MTQYEEDFDYPVAFPPEHPSMTLPKALAQRGVRQLHVAETEKYAHVTYFFSCGEEEPFEGERRELVPSNREVPTYDYAPEMSAPAAARAFVDAWREDSPTFGIINFANSDMVGHTGVIEAAVRGVETVDRCLGEVVAAVHESGGAVVITADHGNSDHMLEDDGSPNTAHSLNPVPFIVTVHGIELRDEGVLADVAPTVLEILGFEQPSAMTGRSMIERTSPQSSIEPVARKRAIASWVCRGRSSAPGPIPVLDPLFRLDGTDWVLSPSRWGARNQVSSLRTGSRVASHADRSS